MIRLTSLPSYACALALGCSGAIGADDANGRPRGGADQPAGRGGANDESAAGAGGPLAGPGGPDAIDGALPPRFACTSPEARGLGQPAMRRLTRDELVRSLTAVVGEEPMAAASVTSALSRIPEEPPGDLVASFQNGYAFDHVEGILLTAEALAAEVSSDDAARERVLGACADAADRACAEAFLDDAALRLMRRPLDATRRAALLAAFESEGAGVAGMQWLLSRVIQAPESVFHLELPRQVCEPESAPVEARYAWDDESVFFAPHAGGTLGAQASVTENGWFVWQLPGERIAASYAELVLELTVESDDDVPLELDVNMNDTPLMPELTLPPGAHTLRADVAIAEGSPVKVGVQLKNAAAGRALVLDALVLRGGEAAPTCEAAPIVDDVYEVDDWSVASRLAYALTGQGPDQALLDAAAAGELDGEDALRPHAERLIESPAARTQLEAILTDWLNLNAIPTPHAAIAERAGVEREGLAEEARRELLDYAVHQILDRDADTTQLMSDAIGFPRSERMATLYGSEVASGDAPVELPNGHGGLLLRVAPLLSGKLASSPILRGVYVRKRILCDALPSPDFTIVNSRLEEFEAQDKTKMSNREAVTEITSQGACPGCHVEINPIGFTLERFDPIGQPRDEEIVLDASGEEIARHPIDAHVTDANLEDGLPSELDGAEALNQALGASAKVRACVAERLYEHAKLRPDVPADACALSEVEALLREGGSIREAWLRAVVSRELFVREAAPEVMP